MNCLWPAADQGAVIINGFACAVCVPDQEKTGARAWVERAQGVAVTVIILQQSAVTISEQIRHKQKVSMRQENAIAALGPQPIFMPAPDMRRQ